jgi:hypothetical protein
VVVPPDKHSGPWEDAINDREAAVQRLNRLVVILCFLAIFTMAVRVSVDTDTWWHLRAGKWILENGRILSQDPFSLTRHGQAWIYPGWIAQIVLFSIYQAGGYAGLNLFTALMVVLAFAFLWRTMEGPSLVKGFTTLLAATASGVYWSARPQIVSFALTGVFFWVLEKRRREDPRWLALLPVLMAFWANLHGGFAIGLLLLVIYFGAEVIEGLLEIVRDRASIRGTWEGRGRSLLYLVAVTAFTVLAVGINPHGFQMLAYPFKTVSVGVLQDYIQEWQSPNFHRLEAQPFLWMLLLAFIAFASSSDRCRAVEILLVVGFGYMSFMAGRNIALFALVAAPSLARHGASTLKPILAGRGTGAQLPEKTARFVNGALVLLACVASLLKIQEPLKRSVNEAAFTEQVPVAASSHLLEQGVEGPLFNSYNWGGYVIWKLYPRYLSFVDGRTDLFNDEILEDYLQVWRAENGWEAILSEWNIQMVMVEPYAPLAQELKWRGWSPIYQDGLAVIFQRPED